MSERATLAGLGEVLPLQPFDVIVGNVDHFPIVEVVAVDHLGANLLLEVLFFLFLLCIQFRLNAAVPSVCLSER